MNAAETLTKLKETISHNLSTGLAVQFSDLDLLALSEATEDLHRVREMLWNTFGGSTRYGDDGEMQGRGIDFKRDSFPQIIKLISDYPIPSPTKEFCICAAVLAEDGTLYRGQRHGDCIGLILASKKRVKSGFESQGFITSRNRFVGRHEGFELQKESGIPSAAEEDGCYRGEVLFSEDLY